MGQIHVLSICNALIDLLVEVSDDEFELLDIEKGIMHLVDSNRQRELLQKFSNHKFQYELGGSAMNCTRALAMLGAKTMFFGMIGKDDFGERIKNRMNQLGIASKIELAEEPTGSCAILITPDGERTMNTCLGASSHYHEGVIPHDDIRNAMVLHFTGYQWSTNHQMRAVKRAVETAKEYNTTVSFDVADPFMVRNFRDEFISMIQEADIVFANADEASELYNTSPEDAANKIAATGAIAVIKLGAKGALIKSDSTEVEIAPVKTKVVDTIAAGDMFAGGFLYGMTHDKSLKQSGEIAALLASDVISRVGATLSDDAIVRAKQI